jgi:hypothetical protein
VRFAFLGLFALLAGGLAGLSLIPNNAAGGYAVLLGSMGVAVALVAFSLTLATNRRAKERAELEDRRAEHVSKLLSEQLEELRAIRRRLHQLTG